MSYNNPRNYNTRQTGRFNRPGSFVPASSSGQKYQTYEVPAAMPPPPPAPPALLPAPPAAPLTPAPPFKEEDAVRMCVSPVPSYDDTYSTTSTTTSTSTRMPYFKTKPTGLKKISNKERRRRQNALLRRLTSPKNALMCINEMLPNEQIANQFKVEPAPLNGHYFNHGVHNFCAQLTLDGVTYKGYGENKLVARNAAAEQAIRDIVLKKMERYSELMAQHTDPDASAGAGTSSAGAEDAGAGAGAGAGAEAEGGEALPMIQLLSFALHKLFAEWEGAGHHVPQLKPRQNAQIKIEEDDSMDAPSQADAAGSGAAAGAGAVGAAGGAGGGGGKGGKGPKKVPENASSMHPAMLLTILRPHAAYRELACEGDKPQNMMFSVAVDIDDKTYSGRATNKKEARKAAARAACKALLGITFDDEQLGIPTLTSH